MDSARRKRLLEQVESFTEIPLLFLSLVMIPLLIGPSLFDLSPEAEQVFVALDWFIWAVFAVDLSVRTYLTDSRISYLRRNWLDVMIVALPFLRPLRILRSARVLRLIRVARPAIFMARAAIASRRLLRARYVLLFALLLVIASAGLVTFFESGSGGTINNFVDGLWWAASTVSTVGYGDAYPVSPEGRAVAVLVMFGGIAFFSAITANLAAFLVKPDEDEETKLDELKAEIAQIKWLLMAQQAGDRTQPQGDPLPSQSPEEDISKKDIKTIGG